MSPVHEACATQPLLCMLRKASKTWLVSILYLSSSVQQCGIYGFPQPMRMANTPNVFFHASSPCSLLAPARSNRMHDEAARLSAQNVMLLPPSPSFRTPLFARVFVLVYQRWANAPVVPPQNRQVSPASPGEMSLLWPWLQRTQEAFDVHEQFHSDTVSLIPEVK